jgi:hypothetical protein
MGKPAKRATRGKARRWRGRVWWADAPHLGKGAVTIQPISRHGNFDGEWWWIEVEVREVRPKVKRRG